MCKCDKNDPRHKNLVDDAMKIFNKKQKLGDPLIQSCKCLTDYLRNDDLYNDYLKQKLDKNFADQALKAQKEHPDDPDVINNINKLLTKLSDKNPEIKEFIDNNGGLVKPAENQSSVGPDLVNRLYNLWDLVNESIKNDTKNQILDPANTNKVRDLIRKLNNIQN